MTGIQLSGEEFIGRLNAIVESRLSDDRFGVSKLAQELAMSRSTLHRKVWKAYHISASRYISHKRLEKARQLLLNKKNTISETASLCGFHSVTYFDKCFHDYFGYPPGETGKHSLDKKQIGSKIKFRNLKKWFNFFK